jgi:hypothetical protein
MRKVESMQVIETSECPGHVLEQYNTPKGLYFRMFEKTANGLIFVGDWYKV